MNQRNVDALAAILNRVVGRVAWYNGTDWNADDARHVAEALAREGVLVLSVLDQGWPDDDRWVACPLCEEGWHPFTIRQGIKGLERIAKGEHP
jgi:hypothetical protein